MATGLFKTSLAKKFWMSLTGLFLVSFLVIHCIVNAGIFFNDDGDTFNRWANFMGTNLIVRTMEIVLFAGLILHIVDGLVLYFQNRKARPVGYAYEKPGRSSTWYSRSMALLGTLLLLFLIMHIYHFWLKTRLHVGGHLEQKMIDGELYENLYAEMLVVFRNWWVVVLYILGCISLFWHLLHGFKSAFQSIGFNHSRYKKTIAFAGNAFSVIVPAIFAAMPIFVFLKTMH